MISLRYIKTKSFRVLADQRVDFPERGLVLLTGVNRDKPELQGNAVGKSALLEALIWAMHGQTPSGRRGRQVATRGSDGQPEVEIGLVVDGRPTRLRRTTSPEAVTLNGRPADARAPLGLSYEQTRATVAADQFGRGFAELTPAERMTLLSQAIDLTVWNDLIREARERSALLVDLHNRIARARAGLRGRLDALGTLPAAADDPGAVEAARTALSEAEARQQARRAEVEALQEQRDRLDVQARQAVRHAREVERLDSSIQERLSAYWSRREQLNRTKAELKSKSAIECPTCKQTLPLKQVAKIKKEKRAILQWETGEVNRLARGIKEDKQKLTELRKAAVEDPGAQVDDLNGKIRIKQTQLEKAVADVATCRARLDQAERAAQGVQDLQRQRWRLRGQIEDADTLLAYYEARRHDLGYWRTAGNALKLWAVQHRLGSLSDRVTAQARRFGLPGRIAIRAGRMTQAGTVSGGLSISRVVDGQDEPIEDWSGGERQRIKVACALALGEAIMDASGTDLRFEFWDEPTRYLNPLGVSMLFETLRERARDRLVVLVDHNPVDVSGFDHQLTLVREGGRSRVG